MRVTILLTLGLMALFALMILVVTVFLPLPGAVLSFWPEDIQERLRPRMERLTLTKKRIAGMLLFALILLGMVWIFVYAGVDGVRRGYSYSQLLGRFLCIGVGVKLLDILGFDYFVMTKTHFFQHFFPETEGCAGWQDFGYNRRQQLRQCVMILVMSPLTAAVFWLIAKYISQ